MNARGLRRYLNDLAAGRRPKPFEPDDFEAEQLRTAIDLRAAREGADEPSPEFVADLQNRLGAQMAGGSAPPASVRRLSSATRRQVVVGTSAAAAAAVAAVAVDRLVTRGDDSGGGAVAAGGGELTPNDGSWQAVGASDQIADDGDMHPFEVGSVIGFVRRVEGKPEAVSGICTHQGCRLWFDKPDTRLRCPCHLTSFSPDGDVVTHQLPSSPPRLPKLEVREADGMVQVFAPAPGTEPA